MTVYELAVAHCRDCGMTEEDAETMITHFGGGEGKDIGWADIAPRLLPSQLKRIDAAAVGWLLAHRRAT